MAVVNTKADIVSNLDRQVISGLPNLLNSRVVDRGNIKTTGGFAAVAAADSANSTYRCGRVKSSWALTSIKLLNDALGAGALVSIGLYNVATGGGAGAVVSIALFAAAVAVAAAGGPTEERYNALHANTSEQMVWQLLGLAADPGLDYDLVATLTTAGGTAGNIALLVQYVDGQD